jgi:hypothetical protein
VTSEGGHDTDDRILIKGWRGSGTAWGTCLFKVTEDISGLASKRMVEMLREVVGGEMMHRLIWCRYLPELVMEEEPDTSSAKLLV